jgi:hypothetical protein
MVRRNEKKISKQKRENYNYDTKAGYLIPFRRREVVSMHIAPFHFISFFYLFFKFLFYLCPLSDPAWA